MMNHSILYLSYDGMTDPLGQSQVLPYLVGLSKKGYNITLISFEKPKRFEQQQKSIKNVCYDSFIKWIPLNYTKWPPVFSTIRDIWVLKRTIKKLHAEAIFDLVHCRSYVTSLVGLWMKKKYGIRFIFDMRGFWADERVDGGLWDLRNPIFNEVYKYFKNKEIQFLENADQIISLTLNAKNDISSWPKFKYQKLPIEIIPCCVDLNLFDPLKITKNEIDEKRKFLGISKEADVISYVGSLGTWYMLGEMLDFFKNYLEAKHNSFFLFVTHDKSDIINNMANQKGIPLAKIKVVAAYRKDMPLYISLCDFSLFFIKPVYSKRASSPTKQGEIMGMGKPVICNSGVGDTDFVINKYKSGILVKEFCKDSYLQVLNEMRVEKFDPEDIRSGALDYFSLEIGINKFENVYKRLLDGRG